MDLEQAFAKGYKAYIKGDWTTAGEIFKKLIRLMPNDGPTKKLHEVININGNGVAPANWKGYRELTSK